VARPLEYPERESNDGPKQFENAIDGDSHQPEWDQQNPDQRIKHQREECKRPAEEKKNAPEKELNHRFTSTIGIIVFYVVAKAKVPHASTPILSHDANCPPREYNGGDFEVSRCAKIFVPG
jgi:hypothetical protein